MTAEKETEEQEKISRSKGIIGWAVFMLCCFLIMLLPETFMIMLPIVLAGYWLMASRGCLLVSIMFSVYFVIVAVMLGGLLRISLSTLIGLTNVGLIVYRTCFSYLKHSYWAALINGVAFGLFGIGCALVFSSLVPAVSISDLVYENVVNSDSMIVQALCESHYEKGKFKEGEKLNKGDEGYALAARKYGAEQAMDSIDMLPYHAIGTVVFSVGVGGLIFLFFGGRIKQLRGLRLNRRYLFYVVIPAFAIGILSFVDGVKPFTSTVVNSAVTVPTGLMFYTLAFDFVARFKTRGRIIAGTILSLVCLASFVYPIIFFIVSLIGLSDAVINLRKYLDVFFRPE